MIPPSDLLKKYNLPVPRYTSYPTVPFWEEQISVEKWATVFGQQLEKNNEPGGGMSLYIHLPFCESLCTYCGCNKKITTNHDVEKEYLAALVREWDLHLGLMEATPMIKEIHLGGGTPTFFSSENLAWLLSRIFGDCTLQHPSRFSFEGHPNNTSKAHLKTLYDLGFRRVSFGVQDLDPRVQRAINRIQPLEHVQRVTRWARDSGYQSVNFDLIYGLPFQTQESISSTIDQCVRLRPDRIAFYSYAHVPWTSRGQRLFDENDLPKNSDKLQLYLTGKQMLLDSGYRDVGMDHFALPGDELFSASENGKLYRNFMGYTTQESRMVLGLGVSAISDCGNAYGQNAKALHDYYALVSLGRLPVQRGYFLHPEDHVFKQYILDVSCRKKTIFQKNGADLLKTYSMPVLQDLEKDGLVQLDQTGLRVTQLGEHFIRNICRAFDLYLLAGHGATQQHPFSKAI